MPSLFDLPDLNAKSANIFAGMVCILAYAIVRRDKASLQDGIIAFLNGNCIVGGGYLCILSLNQFICENPGLEQNRSFVFLGGAAVFWVSFISVRKKLQKAVVVAQ